MSEICMRYASREGYHNHLGLIFVSEAVMQAIIKYINETSNPDIILLKSTN